MKKHLELLLIAILTALAFSAFAQEADPIYAEKMEYFKFMEGQWGGPVEVPSPDGTSQTIQQHEQVEFKLKGTMLMIEGTGTGENGEVLFNAIATIVFDKPNDAYKMYAFRSNGQHVEADVEILGDKHLIWSFPTGNTGFVKYELQVTPEDRWQEQGSWSKDGEQWNKFFEMDLGRTK